MKVFSWIVAFLLILNECAGERLWDYEPLSVKGKTSDPAKMRIEAEMERIGRDHVITGLMEWNYDTDDTTFIEGLAYRSVSGSEDDYIIVPWTISKQTFKQYTDTYYRTIIYKNLENCSTLPHPDTVDSWPRGLYKLDKCVLNGEGLPDLLVEGYYKIIFTITGEVEWSLELVLKIVTKKNILG